MMYVEIEETDYYKTGFISHHKLYRLSFMPFRLCNASETFQQTLDVRLTPVKGRLALVYFDDIIIFSQSTNVHMEHVCVVKSMPHRAGVTQNLKKGKLLLGHLITWICDTCKSLETRFSYHGCNTLLEVTLTVAELHSFFEFSNVFWSFIQPCINCCHTQAQTEKKETQTTRQLVHWGNERQRSIISETYICTRACTTSWPWLYNAKHWGGWPKDWLRAGAGSAIWSQETTRTLVPNV